MSKPNNSKKKRRVIHLTSTEEKKDDGSIEEINQSNSTQREEQKVTFDLAVEINAEEAQFRWGEIFLTFFYVIFLAYSTLMTFDNNTISPFESITKIQLLIIEAACTPVFFHLMLSPQSKEYIHNMLFDRRKSLREKPLEKSLEEESSLKKILLEEALKVLEDRWQYVKKPSIFEKPSLVYVFLKHHFSTEESALGQATLIKESISMLLDSNLTAANLSDFNSQIFSTSTRKNFDSFQWELIDKFKKDYAEKDSWNLNNLGSVPNLRTLQFLILSSFAQSLQIDKALFPKVDRNEFMEAYVVFREEYRKQLSLFEKIVFDARIAPLINLAIKDHKQIPDYAELCGTGVDSLTHNSWLQETAKLAAENLLSLEDSDLFKEHNKKYQEGVDRKKKQEEVKHDEVEELKKKEEVTNALKNPQAERLSQQEQMKDQAAGYKQT